MDVHLVDGTYELFRYHFAPNNRDPERGAVVGVLRSLFALVQSGATHVGVATDHVIESFRNDLYPGYKTSAGMPPELMAQFEPLEAAVAAAGFIVWPLVEFEADDGLAAAAAMAAADDRVERVVICTPDKDLAQCVVEDRVWQWDRRQDKWFDVDGVVEKFGVRPESIPDWLGVVGDSADGFPGLPGWGAKSAGAVLYRYAHYEDIPPMADDWDVDVRSKGRLAKTLRENLQDAVLFRRIATLEVDAPVSESVDDLRWIGPTDDFAAVAEALGRPELASHAEAVASR